MRKNIIKAAVAVLLIVLAIGTTHVWKHNLTQKTEESGHIVVTLTDLNGKVEEKEVPFIEGDYLIDCLEREFDNVKYEMGQYGAKLLSISSIDTDFITTYIAIYIDNQYATVGASYIALSDGLTIQLTETKI